MLPEILPEVLEVYRPLSVWDSFYLRTRWRLCPFELVESLVPKSGNILDFGCGYGMLANLLNLKSPSRMVVGIDMNEKRISVAKHSIGNRRNISFHCNSLESTEAVQNDAVVMTDVLHHIDDYGVNRLFETINLRLSDNGIIIILDVDKAPLWKFCVTYLIDRLLNPGSGLYYRSQKEMRLLLDRFPVCFEKVIYANRGLPLSDIIYVCRKNPNVAKVEDAPRRSRFSEEI